MIDNLDKISYTMADDYEAINQMYIKEMGKHVRDIGKLTSADLNVLEQWARMGANIEKINKELQKTLKKTRKEMRKLLIESGSLDYTGLSKYYTAKGLKQVAFTKNKRMMQITQEVARLTDNAFRNISRTTSIQKYYRQAVDRGIYAVTNGLEDYNSAVRRVVKNSALNGTKVNYASGYRRRMDSAARMNILDGVRTVSNNVRLWSGKEFGSDGVEIDAHGLCALDHLGIQGKQLTNAEFEEFQNDDTHRPIGELNCGHMAYPILLGVSEPVYSDEELQEMKDYSKELIDIKDKQVSRYECSQEMRKIETKIREQKDLIVLGESTGDITIRTDANAKINEYKKTYYGICKASGLSAKPYRFS